MGLKCSLFGHAYGETAVERDREEQGSEVVITIREVDTCTRCGETRVVSENKEVTTIETPEDVSAPPEDDSDEDADASSDPAGDLSGGPAGDASVGAEIVDAEDGQPVSGTASGSADPDDDPAEDDGTTPAGEGDDGMPSVGGEEGPSPAEDDGVILEDEDDEPDRDPGKWPEETEADASDRGYGPEEADGIERFTDEPADGSAEDDPADADDTSGTATVGDTSDAAGAPEEDSEVWSKADPDLDADRPDGTVTVPDGQFRCPECAFSTPVASSSLREGDFCPECHRGTLVHESD